MTTYNNNNNNPGRLEPGILIVVYCFVSGWVHALQALCWAPIIHSGEFMHKIVISLLSSLNLSCCQRISASSYGVRSYSCSMVLSKWSWSVDLNNLDSQLTFSVAQDTDKVLLPFFIRIVFIPSFDFIHFSAFTLAVALALHTHQCPHFFPLLFPPPSPCHPSFSEIDAWPVLHHASKEQALSRPADGRFSLAGPSDGGAIGMLSSHLNNYLLIFVCPIHS